LPNFKPFLGFIKYIQLDFEPWREEEDRAAGERIGSGKRGVLVVGKAFLGVGFSFARGGGSRKYGEVIWKENAMEHVLSVVGIFVFATTGR